MHHSYNPVCEVAHALEVSRWWELLTDNAAMNYEYINSWVLSKYMDGSNVLTQPTLGHEDDIPEGVRSG